jgi:hypothetical protein
MRGFSLFACLYWCANANPALADSAQTVAGSCRPLVTITPDNDVRLDDDKRPPGQSGKIPDQVLSKIRTLAAQALRKIEAPDPYPGECEDLYGKIFRISTAPGLYLYAAEISPVSPIKLLFLILFDPATGALTKDPPRIEMKSTQIFGWKDPLLRQPLISLAGLPINQSRQIVVEERVHNGTMYNAVVYNYFEVGPDLSLTRVLAFEPRAYSIGKQEGLIVRTLQSIGPNQQRLESSLETNAAPHQRQDLGYVILERAGPGHPFQVKERHPKSRNNDSILVTYSGAMNPGADDKFLREGYTFHY